MNLKSLEKKLSAAIEGEVRFDDGSRALYATDSSNYRQVPLGVVIPKTKEDIVNTVKFCFEIGAPILARGAGTSLAGQTCNVAVIIDMSKYFNRLLEVNADNGYARVEPGIILDTLRREAEKHHLTFGPDPATHAYCTLGGMIGNNSCGVHSVMAGMTSDNVEELEILLYDGTLMKPGKMSPENFKEKGRAGEIYRGLKTIREKYESLIRTKFPDIPRRVSGYNFPELLKNHAARALVGSESTCALVLEAKVKLIPSPPARSLLALGYHDVYAAADAVPELMESGPVGLEGFDEALVRNIQKTSVHAEYLPLLPQGKGWLLVEFGGETKQESDEKARMLMAQLSNQTAAPDMKLCETDDEARKIWKVRESALGATARVPGEKEAWEGWEDSAVPPKNLGTYLRELRGLYDKFGYQGAFYGHFGQGCVHTRTDFDLKTKAGVTEFRRFVHEAADLVVGLGGSISGEHGDGQARSELLVKMFGPELIDGFREFKRLWDPLGKMNPGKIVDPYRVDENLRYGEHYAPAKGSTHFQFPDDRGSFADATERCVGVGLCRRLDGGTMCPSFMATREEKDSTRGRARLLFEMLNGEAIPQTWRNEAVKESLDLCLSCKGCKSDCPLKVDMATYKAEFLSHYYKGRLRPAAAYTMGLIPVWARLASNVPGVVNFFTQTPPFSNLAKWLAGISPKRKIPKFAQKKYKECPYIKKADKNKVLLWTDTFTNYFQPEIGWAAAQVLENFGYAVTIPNRQYCCGRPLYDFGMLDMAKRRLSDILDGMQSEIEKGTPFIGLEPSCIAVFRDELLNLFPDDARARTLSKQFFTLSEFLEKEKVKIPKFKDPPAILVQGHCHQKSIMTMKSDEAVLRKTGANYTILDAGCCGMAGAFGFEKDHYDISMQIAGQALFPKIREAAQDTLILADGFSCREQIRQSANQKPLHLAEFLLKAMEEA